MTVNTTSTCEDDEAFDRFFCTEKGLRAMKQQGGGLSARQRQLLLLLSKKEDEMSRTAGSHLLTKISVKELVDKGLISTDNPCKSVSKDSGIEKKCRNNPSELYTGRREVHGLLDKIEKIRMKDATPKYSVNPIQEPEDFGPENYQQKQTGQKIDPALELIAKSPL